MSRFSPAAVLELAFSQDPVKRATLRWQVEAALSDLQDQGLCPSPAQLGEAAVSLSQTTNLEFSPHNVTTLLSFFPRTRIAIARHGVGDTKVRDQLLDSLAEFLLGCSWPRGADNVDIKTFVALVSAAGAAVGFGTPSDAGIKNRRFRLVRTASNRR